MGLRLFFPPTFFPHLYQLECHPSTGLSSCTALTSSCSVVAVFFPLQSPHPKSQHLQLVTTICTMACIVINKQGTQVTAHTCPSTGYYQAINSLAQKTLNTLNRCPGSFFPGSFSFSLLSGWAHAKHRPPLQSIPTDLQRVFYFIALHTANQSGRERWGKPHTAESFAGLSFVLPCLESHKRKI